MTSDIYRKATDSLSKLVRRRPAIFRAVTILSGDAESAWAALDGPPWKQFSLDLEGNAHSEYGVAQASGAIVVIRPDHIHGYAAPLDAASDVADYFAGFI